MPVPQRGGQKLIIMKSLFYRRAKNGKKQTNFYVMYLSIHLAFCNVYVHLYIAKSGSISTAHTASWISKTNEDQFDEIVKKNSCKDNLSWCSIGAILCIQSTRTKTRHLNSTEWVTNKRTLLKENEIMWGGETVAHATRFRVVLRLHCTILWNTSCSHRDINLDHRKSLCEELRFRFSVSTFHVTSFISNV